MPLVAVAGGDNLCSGGPVVDGQLEGGGAVATQAVDGVEGVGAADSVVHAVPAVAVASGDVSLRRGAVVDGEVQVGGAVAAVGTGTSITRSTS